MTDVAVLRRLACVAVWSAASLAAQDPPARSLTIELGDLPIATIDGEQPTRLTGHAAGATELAAGACRFAAPSGYLDFGPHQDLGFDSTLPFTLEVELQTTHANFCTPLMCRDGDAVHYSLVLGRTSGTIAFETWSWQKDRAISRRRIDDGQWHRVTACFDPEGPVLALWIDGELEAMTPTSTGFRRQTPLLRLGNNVGTEQPFPGALRSVSVRNDLPPGVRDDLRLWRQSRLLDRAEVDARLDRWLAHLRQPKPPQATSKAAWLAEAQMLRARLQDALGLWPPPYGEASVSEPSVTDFVKFVPSLPLDPHEGGRLQRDRYSLTRIYLQTFAGYYASGWLYRPDQPHPLRPAVLCPHGHWQDGARHPVVQSRCIALAQRGYTVLAMDSVHTEDDPIGLSPLSVMTWNNLRALAWLRSMPTVDPERIACTGASGGAQQTFYLTALDCGLAAAVPAVMVCWFDEILQPHDIHCACNFTPRLAIDLDQPTMAACFAPKPQLFLSVTGDWTKNFPTRGFPDVQRIYALLGAAPQVAGLQFESQHDYSRPMRNAMYAWLARWLEDEPDPNPELEAEGLRTEDARSLRVLDRRDLPQDPAAAHAEFRARLASPPLTAAGMQSAAAADQLRALTTRLSSLLLEREPDLAGPRLRTAGALRWRGLDARTILVRTDADLELPALVLMPEPESLVISVVRRPRVCLVVGDGGKSEILLRQQAWIAALLAAGIAAVVADVRYTGELDAATAWREPYGRIFGRDPGVLAVHDLRRLLDALPEIRDVNPNQAMVLAFGDLGAPALLAAALDPRIKTAIIPELGPNYRDHDRRPKIVRLLRHGDLDDAACLMAPRPLLVGGCAPEQLAAAQARYQFLAVPERLASNRDPLEPRALRAALGK